MAQRTCDRSIVLLDESLVDCGNHNSNHSNQVEHQFMEHGADGDPLMTTMSNVFSQSHGYHTDGQSGLWHHCHRCQLPITTTPIIQLSRDHCETTFFHESCIECCLCHTKLYDKCYQKNGQVYCSDHYYRNFSPTRCTGCGDGIGPSHLVYRVHPPSHLDVEHVYHFECHVCAVCGTSLTSGDSMAVNEFGIMCERHHYEEVGEEEGGQQRQPQVQRPQIPLPQSEEGGRRDGASLEPMTNATSRSLIDMSSTVANIENNVGSQLPISIANKSISTRPKHPPRRSSRTHGGQQSTPLEPQMCVDVESGRTYLESPPAEAYFYSSMDDMSAAGLLKRRGPRTTIKMGQLDVLNRIFEHTPKPSKHARAKLALETGLSMRVIQVWFQNRRSKERRLKHLCNWIREHESRGVVPPISRTSMQAVGMEGYDEEEEEDDDDEGEEGGQDFSPSTSTALEGEVVYGGRPLTAHP